MSLDSLINIAIDVQATAVSRAGFGTVMIAGYHTHWSERTRTYDSATVLETLSEEGFSSDEPIYLGAEAVVSQNPRPPQVKVGRLDDPPGFELRITPVVDDDGFVYRFTVEGEEIEHEVDDDSIAQIAAALQAQIDAVDGVTAVDDTTHVTVTATAGDGALVNVISQHAHGELEIEDRTPDPGIADGLNAIQSADPDWYGLVIASQSRPQLLAASAWVEARRKLFAGSTQDSAAKDATSTTDYLAEGQAAGYAQSVGFYHQNPMQFAGARAMGRMFAEDPGAATWAYQQLSGLTFSRLSPSELAAIKGKSGMPYVRSGGVNVTLYGWSLAGEYADITRFVHWLHARMQEDLFALLVNRKKIPYTDAGIGLVESTIQARLNAGVDRGGLAEDPAPETLAPKAADVSPNDRASRVLPNVRFTGQLAGAIHELQIQGTLTA